MAYRVRVCTLCLPLILDRPRIYTTIIMDGVDVVDFVLKSTGIHPTVLHDIARRAYPSCIHKFTVHEGMLKRLEGKRRAYTSDLYFSSILYVASLGSARVTRSIISEKLGEYLEPGGDGGAPKFKANVWKLFNGFMVYDTGSDPVECIERGLVLYEHGDLDVEKLRLLAARYMGVRNASYIAVTAYALRDLLPRVFSIASELGVRPGVAVRLLHLAGCANS